MWWVKCGALRTVKCGTLHTVKCGTSRTVKCGTLCTVKCGTLCTVKCGRLCTIRHLWAAEGGEGACNWVTSESKLCYHIWIKLAAIAPIWFQITRYGFSVLKVVQW